MNLFINYYNAGARQNEIDYCLAKNLDNKLIKKIIVFNEYTELNEKKFKEIRTEKRPTYQDFFNEMANYPNDINILANSDIFFDNSLSNANKIRDNQCYAITRWEFDGENSKWFEDANLSRGNRLCPAHFSQDVWIFRGAPSITNCDSVLAKQTNARVYDMIRFTIGIPGCDNVIAAKIKEKYRVINPALDIKCHHYHMDKKPKGYSHVITGARSQWGMIGKGKVNVTRI